MSIHNVMFEGIFQRVIANPKKSRKREGNKKGKINNSSFFVFSLFVDYAFSFFKLSFYQSQRYFFLFFNLGSYKKKDCYDYFFVALSFFLRCYLKPPLLILTERLSTLCMIYVFPALLLVLLFSFDLLLFPFYSWPYFPLLILHIPPFPSEKKSPPAYMFTFTFSLSFGENYYYSFVKYQKKIC